MSYNTTNYRRKERMVKSHILIRKTMRISINMVEAGSIQLAAELMMICIELDQIFLMHMSPKIWYIL